MDLEKLLEQHKDSVYRQLVRTCGGREDAEDALVEALVTAYQTADRLEHPDAFRSWVGTIAGRVCWHIRRADKLRSVVPLADDIEVGDDRSDVAKEAEMSEMKGCIRSAIENLGEGYREVYEMREIEGMRTAEVAEALGLSEAAVKSRLHRAREVVRESLEQSICGGL